MYKIVGLIVKPKLDMLQVHTKKPQSHLVYNTNA